MTLTRTFIFTMFHTFVIENSRNGKTKICRKSMKKNSISSINGLWKNQNDKSFTMHIILSILEDFKKKLYTPKYFLPMISLPIKSTISIKAITITCNGEVLPSSTPKEISTVAAQKSAPNMLRNFLKQKMKIKPDLFLKEIKVLTCSS